MKEKSAIAAIIALSCALLGIVLVYASFLAVYDPIMASEMATGRAVKALSMA